MAQITTDRAALRAAITAELARWGHRESHYLGRTTPRQDVYSPGFYFDEPNDRPDVVTLWYWEESLRPWQDTAAQRDAWVSALYDYESPLTTAGFTVRLEYWNGDGEPYLRITQGEG